MAPNTYCDPTSEALAVIAADVDCPVSALRIESLVPSNPAVFYQASDGTLRSICSLDSDYWRQAVAMAITAQLIARAKGNFSR